MELIHVAIVEDDNDICNTLGWIINASPGFTCVHKYNNAEDAIEAIPNNFIHVILMDINLPKKSGIEAVSELKIKYPHLDFIMLTVQKDDDSVFNSLKAGASGYLVKDTPPVRLLQAIREVHQGGAPMSTSIARRVIMSFRKVKKSPLSQRETEILKMLCDGLNYRVIADKLFVSPHTVRTHIKNIYKKLHVTSKAAAIRKAMTDHLL